MSRQIYGLVTDLNNLRVALRALSDVSAESLNFSEHTKCNAQDVLLQIAKWSRALENKVDVELTKLESREGK